MDAFANARSQLAIRHPWSTMETLYPTKNRTKADWWLPAAMALAAATTHQKYLHCSNAGALHETITISMPCGCLQLWRWRRRRIRNICTAATQARSMKRSQSQCLASACSYGVGGGDAGDTLAQARQVMAAVRGMASSSDSRCGACASRVVHSPWRSFLRVRSVG